MKIKDIPLIKKVAVSPLWKF